jgi:hypothetical protein
MAYNKCTTILVNLPVRHWVSFVRDRSAQQSVNAIVRFLGAQSSRELSHAASIRLDLCS